MDYPRVTFTTVLALVGVAILSSLNIERVLSAVPFRLFSITR